jgi:hypothetical protein
MSVNLVSFYMNQARGSGLFLFPNYKDYSFSAATQPPSTQASFLIGPGKNRVAVSLPTHRFLFSTSLNPWFALTF